jgi:hypothetical protein
MSNHNSSNRMKGRRGEKKEEEESTVKVDVGVEEEKEESNSYNNINNEEDIYSNNNNNLHNKHARNGRVRPLEEGHSRKKQRTLANYRRDLVFSLSSQGYNQPMIANKLLVSQAVVSMDLSYLRKQAAESLSNFLSHKLPLIYSECYESISQVIAKSWDWINDTRTPIQAKVALLSLIKDATEAKMELSSGGEIIEQGIAYSQNVKSRYVEITKTNDLLHNANDDDNDDDNSSSNNSSSNNKVF